MITNVFSPRQVLLALLVAVFGACSAAASHADILRDLGSGDSASKKRTRSSTPTASTASALPTASSLE